jgi:hypothetical protein
MRLGTTVVAAAAELWFADVVSVAAMVRLSAAGVAGGAFARILQTELNERQ